MPCIIILIPTLYKLCCNSSTKKVQWIFRWFTIFFILFAMLCTICDVIHCAVNEINGVSMQFDEGWSPFIVTLEFIADTFYFLTTLTLYILFISRLYITFKGSYYELSKLTLIILCIILIIIISYAVFYGISLY